MRFGIGMNTDHTLEEVGQQFSVTRERIRQIEAKALRKLKHPSTGNLQSSAGPAGGASHSAQRTEAGQAPRCRPCAEAGVVLAFIGLARFTGTSRVAPRRVVGDAAHDQSEGATVRGSSDPVDTGGRKLPRERQAVGAGGDDPRVEHCLHRRVRRQRRPAGDGDRSRHVRRRDSVAGQCLHALPFGVSADRGRRRRSFRPPPHIRRRHRGLRRRFTGVRAVGRHDPAHSGARDSRHRGGVADPVLAGDHRSDIR